jgi:glucose/arabinose dehydrogenase
MRLGGRPSPTSAAVARGMLGAEEDAMLAHTARSILFAGLICLAFACGGDDDGGNNPGDDGGGGGNGDGGGGNNADAAVNSCAPVSGTNLALEPVASGLDEPLFVTSPPGDTRLFIVEKLGVIKIVKNGQVLPTPFLEIPVVGESAQTGNEQGLLGLAFHPLYAMNGRFYVFYTTGGPSRDVVIEFTVSDDPDIANPDSDKLILEVDDFAGNHNGGMIAFGPDDMLYIGMGDGGDGGDPRDNGQNRTTLLGDMLRIDVDGGDPYGIPDDNPLVGQGGSVREEIWLSGLRNPWRWSFDLANGDMYIADVGQGTTEEINVVPAGMKGLDLGWDEVEGNECFDDQVTADDPDADGDCTLANHFAPAHVYSPPGDASVTGGYVYRGTCFPDIAGWYFFADWELGRVFKLEYAGGSANNVMDVTDDLDPEGVLDGLAGFGQDIFGEVYVVSLFGGTVHRIVVE